MKLQYLVIMWKNVNPGTAVCTQCPWVMQTTWATRSEEGEISMVWKDDGVREDFFQQVRQKLGVWERRWDWEKSRWDAQLSLRVRHLHSEALLREPCTACLGKKVKSNKNGNSSEGLQICPYVCSQQLLDPARAQPWAKVPLKSLPHKTCICLFTRKPFAASSTQSTMPWIFWICCRKTLQGCWLLLGCSD